MMHRNTKLKFMFGLLEPCFQRPEMLCIDMYYKYYLMHRYLCFIDKFYHPDKNSDVYETVVAVNYMK